MTTPPKSDRPMTCVGPIKIEVGGEGSKPYKSIDRLTWDSVPGFAVLTGLNGAGKSQLLELLAYRLTDTVPPSLPGPIETPVTIIGEKYGPEDIAYLPASGTFAGDTSVGISQLQSAKQQLYDDLQPNNVRHDLRRRARRARLERFFNVTSLGHVPREDFANRLPDDYAYLLEDEDVITGLAHVFVAYRLRFAERLEKEHPRDKIIEELGPPPWEVVNEALRVADFPYRVTSPLDTKLESTYRLLLRDPVNDQSRPPGDLSSGEKVILQLVLWLYNSKSHSHFPRLFLLDEPDAHLHPSMTRQFMDVIQEVLVRQFGVRVILTTHSPSTVALAPEGSVFEMSREAPRIRPSPSKAHTIGLLTAGLVTVFPSTRFVLVEDERDAQFFDAVREILSDYGPSRDPRALKPEPSIVFLPASSGEGKDKIPGGKSVVRQWVEKFEVPPLAEMFRGVVDLDDGNLPTARVRVVGRYSIENYLVDPFVVFGLLLEDGDAPTLKEVTLSSGDEHRIRTLSAAQLRAISVAILGKVEPLLSSLTTTEKAPHKVRFTGGQTVDYPTWVITRRGHDLLPLFQRAFGGPKTLSPPRLLKVLQRIRLVPVELADILHAFQA